MNFLGGLIPVPWEETKFEIQFGEQEKKDIPIEDRIKLIELYKDSDVADPLELVNLFAQAGLGLSKTYDTPEEQMELEMVMVMITLTLTLMETKTMKTFKRS